MALVRVNMPLGGGNKTIVALPYQIGTLDYNGSMQSPTWGNYDPQLMSITGDTQSVNAGNHTVYCTPIGNAVWADGTQTARAVVWTINKVAGSLTLSANSGVVMEGSTITFTVTAAGDGVVRVYSNRDWFADVEISGNTVTVTGTGIGTATITVSQAAGTNHNAPSSQTFEVNVIPSFSSTLNDNSWAKISEISNLGLGDACWDIGDLKEITLNGNIGSCLTLSNTKLCVFILHFNHDLYYGYAGSNIIWGGFKSALKNGKFVALVDSMYGTDSTDGTICFNMNHTGQTSSKNADGYYGTNYGGWLGSDFRYDILGAVSTPPSQYNQIKDIGNYGVDADYPIAVCKIKSTK